MWWLRVKRGSALRKILLTRYFGNQKCLLSKSEFGSGSGASGSFVKPASGGGFPVLDSDKPGSSMVEIQCLLDSVGASELVIDLIVNTKNDRVFEESILFGIALLQGGNTQIQNSFYEQLYKQKKSERFFKVFYDRMRLAQQEIRASVSVNMFELSSRKREDDGGGGEASGLRLRKGKDSALHMREDMRGQLEAASSATSKAFCAFRKELDPELESLGQGSECPGAEEAPEESQMSQAIAIMKPILRYLQLLCENHNSNLQNFLRNQNNKTNYNLVCETLQFLDCICGSTTGGLGLLGLYINQGNVDLVRQTLETITEYCQGPCHENQSCIAKHESNGIDIIIALIVNSINPLGKHRLDLVMELKNNASKLLLAIMESRHDSENAEKILYKMRPNELVDVMKEAYVQGVEAELDEESLGDHNKSKDVGHNIYILAHQLARHSKVMQQLLKAGTAVALGAEPQEDHEDDALRYYANHTAQIEIVRHDRSMEQLVFPVPNICEYLTVESQVRVFTTTERDDQGSKVNDFFQQSEHLYNEMRWQKKIRKNTALFWFSRHISLWGSVSFYLACLLNIAVAVFYPFGDDGDEGTLPPFWNVLLWVAVGVFTTLLPVLPKPWAILFFLVSVILRSIYTMGLAPALLLLGAANLFNKVVFLVSFVGNQGTFTRGYQAVVMDMLFIYHLSYALICVLGLFAHEFFYSFLLFDLVIREETLLNVIKSVTRNGRSILLTADDFRMEVDRLPAQGEQDGTERVCDTLLMCIITVLNQGLRNGGGVGDVLRRPSKEEPLFAARVVSEKQRKEEILKTTCFICGLERDKFDNKTVSFEEHIMAEHNMWHYLYFLVLVRVKDPTEYTGPESYVAHMIKENNLDWFPRMRAMSLVSSEGDGEQNEMRCLQEKLEGTMTLVILLSGQLAELKEQGLSAIRASQPSGPHPSGPLSHQGLTHQGLSAIRASPIRASQPSGPHPSGPLSHQGLSPIRASPIRASQPSGPLRASQPSGPLTHQGLTHQGLSAIRASQGLSAIRASQPSGPLRASQPSGPLTHQGLTHQGLSPIRASHPSRPLTHQGLTPIRASQPSGPLTHQGLSGPLSHQGLSAIRASHSSGPLTHQGLSPIRASQPSGPHPSGPLTHQGLSGPLSHQGLTHQGLSPIRASQGLTHQGLSAIRASPIRASQGLSAIRASQGLTHQGLTHVVPTQVAPCRP
ncbi:hypothetical protein NHX12_002559 [Muraenolepis orangiensis]|uniref:RyR/IP3R Homology associated domain-containing protein n=1 Tax=Muraenolepis orangiensis TaxID=630683 RepID=A0A9Q0DZP4_9TELE|nr:hypothetical protein NHX12_002559 [Muraenolepis orangiensis]